MCIESIRIELLELEMFGIILGLAQPYLRGC